MLAKEVIQNKHIVVDSDDRISTLIGKLESNNETDACVFKNNEYKGVFSHQKLLNSKIDVKKNKVKNYTALVAKIKPHNTVYEIANKMLSSNSTLLPVFDKNKFLGTISIFDVLKHIPKNIAEKEAEFTQIPHVFEDTKISEVLEKMYKHNIREIPVLSRQNKIVGIAKHADLLKKYYKYHLPKESRKYIPKSERINPASFEIGGYLSSRRAVIVNDKITVGDIAKKLRENKVLRAYTKDFKTFAARYILKLISRETKAERIIDYKGLYKSNIPTELKPMIKKVTEERAQKLQRIVNNNYKLKLHFKSYRDKGKKHIYHLQATFSYPGNVVVADKVEGWDVMDTLSQTLDNLEQQLESKYAERLIRQAFLAA